MTEILGCLNDDQLLNLERDLFKLDSCKQVYPTKLLAQKLNELQAKHTPDDVSNQPPSSQNPVNQLPITEFHPAFRDYLSFSCPLPQKCTENTKLFNCKKSFILISHLREKFENDRRFVNIQSFKDFTYKFEHGGSVVDCLWAKDPLFYAFLNTCFGRQFSLSLDKIKHLLSKLDDQNYDTRSIYANYFNKHYKPTNQHISEFIKILPKINRQVYTETIKPILLKFKKNTLHSKLGEHVQENKDTISDQTLSKVMSLMRHCRPGVYSKTHQVKLPFDNPKRALMMLGYWVNDKALKPVFIPELVKSLIKRCKLKKNCLIDARVALLKSVFVGLEGVDDLAKLGNELGNEGRKNVISLVEEIVTNGYFEIPNSIDPPSSIIETCLVKSVDDITEEDYNEVCNNSEVFIVFGNHGIEFIKICVGDDFSADIIQKIGVNPELVENLCSKLELTTSNCSFLLNKLKFPINFKLIENKTMDKQNCRLVIFVKLVQNIDSLMHVSAASTTIYRNFTMIHTLALPIQKYMQLMLTFNSSNLLEIFYKSFARSTNLIRLVRNIGSNSHLKMLVDTVFMPLEIKKCDHLVMENLPKIVVRFLSEDVSEQAKVDYKEYCVNIIFKKLEQFYSRTVVIGVLNDDVIRDYVFSNSTKNSVRLFTSKKNLFMKN